MTAFQQPATLPQAERGREVSGVGSFQVSACIQLSLFDFRKGMGVQNTIGFGNHG
jgi:hypothetical protein